MCTVVVGGFFGDEGKGHVVAYLAVKDRPAVVARGGAGPNAGHTVVHQGRTYPLRLIPSGFVCESARLLIGPGVALNTDVLLHELKETNANGRLGLDANCPIIEEKHIEAEKSSEHLAKRIGSTKSGTGACNADRALRLAKTAKEIPELRQLITDVPDEIHQAMVKDLNVLVEGAHGTYLSLYHGTYPYTISKDVTAAAACSDVGIGPTDVDETVVIFKSFVTRVGAGPLEGELPPEEIQRRGWQEFGTVTGRPRRAAPFDFRLARRAVLLNGATQTAITKLDLLFPSTRGAKSFSELGQDAKDFIQRVENETGVPVTLVGTGPDTWDTIDRRDEVLSRHAG